ncbi:MAG: UDP-3-O-(3-hydroxymyristoyl)glucosamine N-acyltransferase [candidate division FCPU426 bacterium]
MKVTLRELAGFLGARLEGKGDGAATLEGVAALDSAGPGHLSFYSNPKYKSQLAATRAGAVLVSPADAASATAEGRMLLVSANPYRDFALASTRFFPKTHKPPAGIHPGAIVASGARVAADASVGPFCVVEDGAELKSGAILHPFVYVGRDAVVGEDSELHPFAVLLERCRLGKRVILQSGAVIGADGFGFAPDPPNGYVKVPQSGDVVIEDDVEIQATACIDRGALGSTVIGRGSKIDNLVQVAHNVKVGQHTVLAAQVGISGSTKIGDWVTFAGQSAAGGHLNIADQAIITGQAGAGKDVGKGEMVSGSPAMPTMEHHRGLAELKKLPQLKKRLKEMEERLARLENRDPRS